MEPIQYGSYYPKYTEWSRDPRYLDLKMKMGHEGIGILIETFDFLRDQHQYSAEISSIPAIAYQLHASEDKVRAVICDFELFAISEGCFFSPWLSNCLRALDSKREKLSEAGKKGNAKRWANKDEIATPSPGDHNPIAVEYSIESKVKKRRVKKSIEETTEEFESFFSKYDKNVGKQKALKEFNKLTPAERLLAIQVIPKYHLSKPDTQFRKDPANYLKEKVFNDELIEAKHATITNHTDNNARLGTSEARIQAARNF